MFFDLTRHAFTFRRKQMATLLRRAPAAFGLGAADLPRFLRDLQIDADSRPETLSLEQWLRLSNAMSRTRAAERPDLPRDRPDGTPGCAETLPP